MFKGIVVTMTALLPAASVMAAETPNTSTWVTFTSFSYHSQATVTPGSGEYTNPVIAGFYPDPSICRVGEKTVLVNGGTDITQRPIWCEGPHLYKINGTYYLMCAQGGTGHADLVQTQNGEWFSVFLACQPYEAGFYNTGRQTFMLPVTWTDGWPVILPPDTPVPLTVKKPNLPQAAVPPAVATTGNVSFTDRFDSDQLHYRWIGIRKPSSTWYVTSKAAKALFLEPRADLFSGQGNPSYMGIRQQNNVYSCSVTLSARPRTADGMAGLAAFQNEGHYYAINVRIDAGRLTEISLEQSAGRSAVRRRNDPIDPKILATHALPEEVTSIELKIEGNGAVTRLLYNIGNSEFIQMGESLESSFLSTDQAGGFQGVTLGMFAHL